VRAQARGEVARLTGCKAALMRDLIAAKRRELADVCAQAHMAVPPLPPLPADDADRDAAAICSQVGLPATFCFDRASQPLA
jgi:hypothetical protein